MNSLVTIITPVYNNKEDILTAIQSVIAQTYTGWEYVIIDDCSKDGTYELLLSEIKKLNNPKIKLLRNAKNRGTYISINKAIVQSTGKYICLLGSDDTFVPTKLKKQVDILDRDPKILWCDAFYKRETTLVENNVAAQLFRRSIIRDIGYFDSIRFGADSEFKRRVYKHYGNTVFAKISEVLYIATIRNNSLTRSADTGRKDIRVKYRDNFYKWHNDAKKNGKLFIPFPIKNRPFVVDKIMLP
jgi:glycosyltransferase involved in cell wall biosynthesis